MRRARINVKPNFRPGSRSGLAGELTSQGAADTDSTLPTVKAEKPAMPSPSPQVNPPVEETPQALGVKNDPQSPLAKSSPNQHGGAPSSGRSTPDAVPQRRMRLSATPKLSRPRVTSVPRPAARTPSLAVPTLPSDGPGLDSTHETTALDSRNSDNLSDSGIPYSTLPTKVAMTLSTSYPPLSPCVPSTSGLQKPFVHDEKSVEDSPPSPPPGHLPQQPPQEQGAHQCSTQVSGVPSVYAKSTCFDMPGSPKETDKERILKALKLKELMKIEKRRDIERAKKSVRQKREYAALDHSKMTMRDLIYYLPNTSPMKSSMVREEDQAEVTVPPLPKVPEKTQETDEEEAESENEGMLMPKVRVAEDGSIILDEDSLTVRVQRTSDTVVVESSNPLFERGSTTSYTSFRNWNYVKSWSVRETDMFFLAISMVGTDFSLIAQLLPHRSRSEIKNKFKREERASAWRIDKAFRNKRPYDKEFFSFLLERVLAKDKEKGKSIKLVMTQSRKAGKTRAGKKGKKSVCEEECHGDEEDQHFEMEDGGQVYAEKENENLSNVNETDTAPAKRKRKRPRQVNEAKDAEDLSEEQVQRKKRKRSKTTPKGISSPHDGEDESGIFNMADDAVNANKEDELGSNAPTRKKKHKTSRKGGKEGEVEKPAEGRKGSWSRKSLKVSDDHESVNTNESGITDDHSVATMKTCKRSKKGDLKTGGSTKGKKSTKREVPKGTMNEETEENGEASTMGPSEADKNGALVPAHAVDVPQQKSVRVAQKPKPYLGRRGRKRSIEPETTNEPDDIQVAISPMEKGQLQKEAENVMERTPPREKNLHSPSKLHSISKESEPPGNSPASPSISESSSSKQMKMQRSDRAKRNLTFGGQKGRRKGMMDHEESEHDPASEDKESPKKQIVTQESEDSDMDNTLDEKLGDFSYLHALNSPMFQRRPLVMLSREEVDMFLSDQEQTAAKQPSPLPSPSSSPQMSPLDLSLNTELSFQLSNLMEENVEVGQDECVVGGPPDIDSQSAVLESHWEDLEMMESASGQSDPSSTRHFSTTLNSDMNDKPEVNKVETLCPLEKPEPLFQSKTDKDVSTENDLQASASLASLEDVASEDLACTKPNAHGSHKRTAIMLLESYGTSLATQDATEVNKTSVLALVQSSVLPQESCSGVLEGSRASVVAAPQTWDRPQGSVSITTEIKENMQESLSEPAEVVERSQESVVTALEVKEGTQGSVMTTPEIKLRSEGSLVSTPVVKEDSQEDVEVATPDINERSQVLIPEINKYSQGSLREPAEVSERSQETVVPTPEIMEGFQRSQLMSTEIKEDSERSLLETCEVLERSQESVVTTLEIKEGSEDAFLATPEIKASQESRGSLLEPSEVSPMSQEFALLNPKIKQMPEGLVMTTAIIKAHSLEEEEHAIQPSSTKLSSGTSISCEHGGILKRRSRFLKPKPNLNLASRVMNCSPKQKSIEPNTTVSSEKLLLQSSAVDQLCDLDFAKENISKKKGIYLSSVHHAESKPSKVPSGASVTVLEQEQKITTVTLNEVSAPVLQMASDQTKSSCDVVMTPNCQSVADLQKTDTSRVSPLPSQTGQMTETCHVACAPAKVIHSAGDGQSNEEPTFILTLYEIPVTQADLTFASNDSAMTSDLYPVEVPSPPVSSALPSTPYCPSIFLPMKIEETEKECVGISQNELSDSLGMLTEDIGENVTLGLTTTLKRGAEFSEETPETEGSLSPEVIKEKESADTPRPLNTHSQEKSNISSMLEEKPAPKQVMKVDYQGMPQATHQTITHQAKDKYKEGSAKQEAEDISVKSSPQDTEKCEGISHVVLADVLMPVSEDYVSKESAMPEEINIHREGCSSAVHAKTQEIPSEELKKVKHPTAVSSPLFSIMEDSKYKQSLSEEKKAPAKRKEGKLEPKLIKRSWVTNDSMKTDQPVTEKNQSNISQAVLPSQQTMVPQAKEDCSLISTRLETEGVPRMPKLEDKTKGKENLVSDPPQGDVLQQKRQITQCSVSLLKSPNPQHKDSEEDKDYAGVSHVVKRTSDVMQYITTEGTAPDKKMTGTPSPDDDSHKKAIDTILASQEIKMLVGKDESSEMSQSDMEPIHSELAPMILPSPWQSKIHEVDNVPNETATKLLSEDFAIKEDMNSRSKDKESSGSVDLNEAEEEREGVSHMVLADVFVPVSEEMGEDLSEDWQLPFVSSPTREEVSHSKMQENHFRIEGKVEKAKDLSTAFAETMKQNYSSSKESKALARRTVSDASSLLFPPQGKQRVKRASAKNYPSKTAENITEQSQPMSQAVSATSHPTVVPHSNKDSHDPSTKLKKTDILYVPKVEPGSIAKQRSNLADGEEELRRKHAIMPCTVRLSKCLDAQLQEQRPQKAKDDLEKGSNESLNKVQTATTSYSPKVELSLEGKGDSVVTSHKGVCSQGYPEAKLSAKTICTDSLFVDFEETGPEKNCVAHMVSEELRENKLKKAAISSPVQTASEDSRERSIIEEGILKEPPVLVGKNSPAKVKANLKLPFAKRLDKKNESSNTNPPFLENRDLNPTRTVSRMRQLPITVWAKKMSIQPAAELKAEDLSKMSKMKSNFKVKESLPLFSNKSEGVEVGHQSTNLTSCSKVQPRDLKETEQAHERVSLITEMETTGDIPTMSEINKESSEGPSGSHVKTLPARRRAKIRVKPTLFKRTCTKDEDTSSKTGQTLSTQFTSRPQHDQAAKIKEESEQTTNQHTRHLSDISQIEKINSEPMESSSLLSDSWLPKSPALSPRVVLSRVAVQIGETGSSSCTPASSPVKVSTSTYQPMTPPQWMPSCVGPPLQSNSPTSPVPSENTEDEPARVSQFFIHDIFTEIVDAD